MFDLNELAKKVHQNAVDHGFWEDDDIDRQIALIHSEWSEALQADRSGCTKQEVCMELIDGVLRVLDFCAANGFRVSYCLTDDDLSFFELICFLHHFTNQLLWYSGGAEKNVHIIVSEVFKFVIACGFDPYALMRHKYEYNLTRPKKHGKKY